MSPALLCLKAGKNLSIAIVDGAMCIPEACVYLLRRSIAEVEKYGILTGNAKAVRMVLLAGLITHRSARMRTYGPNLERLRRGCLFP